MKHQLEFLRKTGVIETLLQLHKSGYTDRKTLASQLGIGERALYERMKVLKEEKLVNFFGALTGRGKVIAVHLNNMNFFLNKGQEEKENE